MSDNDLSALKARVFDAKCERVARRLGITVEEVTAVFDTYDEVSREWDAEHRAEFLTRMGKLPAQPSPAEGPEDEEGCISP